MIAFIMVVVAIVSGIVWVTEKCVGANDPRAPLVVRELGVTVLLLFLVSIFITQSLLPFLSDFSYVFGLSR